MEDLILELRLHATQCAESRYPRTDTAEETIYGRAAARIEELEAVAVAAREVVLDAFLVCSADDYAVDTEIVNALEAALAAINLNCPMATKDDMAEALYDMKQRPAHYGFAGDLDFWARKDGGILKLKDKDGNDGRSWGIEIEDGSVCLYEMCDENFGVDMTPEDAILALKEAISWIEENANGKVPAS
ncbi:MAG: hypothetical protein KAT62_02575 [Desulfuromonadales bacterium]|nr:hypothetical protein [Desulfuromonadales bacterium]